MSRNGLAFVGCFAVVAALTRQPAMGDMPDPIDTKKVVGTWTLIKCDAKDGPPPGAVITMEFTKDGKVNSIFTFNADSQKSSGTWTVKGDKITTVIDYSGSKKTEVLTIKTLTDSQFVVIQEKGDQKITGEFKK